jgi:signal transduction histidine kinase
VKFKYKLMFTIILLLCLSFGCGGTLLIDRSAESAINQSVENSLSDYMRIQNSLSLATSNGENSLQDFYKSLGNLYINEYSGCVGVQVLNKEKNYIAYSDGTEIAFHSTALSDDDGKQCQTTIWNENNKYYLQVSGLFYVQTGKLTSEASPYVLSTIYDITNIYDTRTREKNIFHYIMLIMTAAGSLASIIIATLLTRPLEKLRTAMKGMSEGDTGSRLSIHTNDEIEDLSVGFNHMADTIESNISELTDSMNRQEEFMGSFAHELKTPMTSIIGYADLIRSHEMSAEEITEASGYIFSEGRRLESLSLKLLELLVAKNQEPNMVAANPADVIAKVVNIVSPTLTQEQIKLKSTCENSLVMMDMDLFQSLITNLVDNARKAMDGKGEIHILGRSKDSKYIIRIKDNGRGMNEEELAHITEAFYRADKSRSRAQGGAGLGLAICSRIVEMHGAALKFKSEPGRGTIVTIILTEVGKA